MKKHCVVLLLFLYFISVQAEMDSVNQPSEENELGNDVKIFPQLISQKLNEKDNRIVGGEEAEPHQFPFQAGLLLILQGGRRGFCGGSLISQNFVLTAAHCVDGIKMVQVILGAYKIRERKEDTQIRMNSTKFIVHENWDRHWLRNDIALVKLPEAVQLNENIQLIDLPSLSDDRDFSEYEAIVSGWGRYSDNESDTSPVLRYANTTIISNKICFINYPLMIRPSNICISGKNGKSSCNGDSGGPLFIQKDQELNKSIEIGIVSFGRADGCEKGHPAVFTRTSSYLNWIKKNSDAIISK